MVKDEYLLITGDKTGSNLWNYAYLDTHKTLIFLASILYYKKGLRLAV